MAPIALAAFIEFKAKTKKQDQPKIFTTTETRKLFSIIYKISLGL
jgi:hypothetical protein